MSRTPSTPATRMLRERGVPFVERTYRYEGRGGTAASSRALGVPEHEIVKTLVMETERGEPLLVLMHGDGEVATKTLAREIGCRSVRPCRPEVAERHTGYRVGGTSPFGTRHAMPVYLQRSVLDLPSALVNGGSRGFLVELDPAAIVTLLRPVLVDVMRPRR